MTPELEGNDIVMKEISALTTINERLRNDYRDDCQKGVDRWNKIISNAGVEFVFTLPHTAFNRNIGTFRGMNFSPEGNHVSREEFDANCDDWMPNVADRNFVNTLMVPVTEPGKMAGWISPPSRGIHGKDVDYEYVKRH